MKRQEKEQENEQQQSGTDVKLPLVIEVGADMVSSSHSMMRSSIFASAGMLICGVILGFMNEYYLAVPAIAFAVASGWMGIKYARNSMRMAAPGEVVVDRDGVHFIHHPVPGRYVEMAEDFEPLRNYEGVMLAPQSITGEKRHTVIIAHKDRRKSTMLYTFVRDEAQRFAKDLAKELNLPVIRYDGFMYQEGKSNV